MLLIDKLREKALSLPQTPGVYIMKNRDGAVIYVGKAKRLKNRVVSYFTDTYHTPKTERIRIIFMQNVSSPFLWIVRQS